VLVMLVVVTGCARSAAPGRSRRSVSGALPPPSCASAKPVAWLLGWCRSGIDRL